MSNSHREPSIDASYHISVHLAKLLESRRFLEIDQSKIRIACGGHVFLVDRDEMSNRYRGPPIDASYKVSVHLAKQFQRRRFKKNRPIRNNNCLWWPCLLVDWDEMSILYRGPSIDASYQISVYLAEGFQRRRLKCEKLTDAKWWQKLTLPLAMWAKKLKSGISSTPVTNFMSFTLVPLHSTLEKTKYFKFEEDTRDLCIVRTYYSHLRNV